MVIKTKTTKIIIVVLGVAKRKAKDLAGVNVDTGTMVDPKTLWEGKVWLMMNWPSRYVDLNYVNLPANLTSIRKQ